MSTGAEHRFDEIFGEYHAEIFRYCVRRLSRDEAEDATADVFAVAWRRIDEIPEESLTRAWLFGVAYRVIGNRYRGKARGRRLSRYLVGIREVASESAEGMLIRDEEGRAVLSALERLGPTDRELLMLATWEGLSHREIAEVLSIKDNTVSQRLVRARARLKIQFETIYGDPPLTDTKEASA